MDLLLIFTLATICALAAIGWAIADTLARNAEQRKDSHDGNH